ncbi:MAG: leishmanolysin-related zinc metalloendopeptidase [Nannocystaceae bacterium]|nr:leishmanolysin [bacterium]
MAGCTERLVLDDAGLVLDTDGPSTDTDATDSAGDFTDTFESSSGNPGGLDMGCVPGAGSCPCPAGQVPRDGFCVDALVDAIEAVVPVDQSALAGDVIDQPPAVRVSSAGAPVSGVPVSFATAGTVGGQVGVVEGVTDANGIATAQSWTLGKMDGTYFVRAAVPSQPELTPVDFTGRTISDFEIVLHYVNPPTDAQFEAFEVARLRWQGALINALPTITGNLGALASQCGVGFDGDQVSITGVHIFVQLQEIDGPGGENGNILGQAGPCALRDDLSPYLGVMTFDTFDLGELEASGSLETVILHEMGHVLGVGSLWDFVGLLENPSIPNNQGADTFFTGLRATDVFFELLGGQPFAGNVVPVENNAQPGSSDSHWRESIVVDELMSPRLGGPGEVAPMSVLTIGSMGDLGFYEANELAADAWALPPQGLVGPGDGSAGALGTDVVLRPQWMLQADGTLTPLSL